MKFLNLLLLLGLEILLSAMSGCAQPLAAPPPWANLPPVREDTIGRLQVDGPQAYLNDMPASNGAYVKAGDKVSTGAKTSAIVILNKGGFVQLDENTDPWFTLVENGACLLVKFAHGQSLFKSMGCDKIQAAAAPSPLGGVLNTMVNLKTSGQEAQVTVLDGRLEITAPANLFVEKFQQYSLFRTGATSLVQLSPEQAEATVEWTKHYFRVPSAQEGASPGAVAAGVGAIGLILWEVFHNHSHSSKPSSESHPSPESRAPSAAPATTTVSGKPSTSN